MPVPRAAIGYAGVDGPRDLERIAMRATDRLTQMARPASLYLAQVRAGRVEIYRDDSTRVDAFDISPGAILRSVLVDHGWRPTGHRVAGGGWGAILVEPIQRS